MTLTGHPPHVCEDALVDDIDFLSIDNVDVEESKSDEVGFHFINEATIEIEALHCICILQYFIIVF